MPKQKKACTVFVYEESVLPILDSELTMFVNDKHEQNPGNKLWNRLARTIVDAFLAKGLDVDRREKYAAVKALMTQKYPNLDVGWFMNKARRVFQNRRAMSKKSVHEKCGDALSGSVKDDSVSGETPPITTLTQSANANNAESDDMCRATVTDKSAVVANLDLYTESQEVPFDDSISSSDAVSKNLDCTGCTSMGARETLGNQGIHAPAGFATAPFQLEVQGVEKQSGTDFAATSETFAPGFTKTDTTRGTWGKNEAGGRGRHKLFEIAPKGELVHSCCVVCVTGAAPAPKTNVQLDNGIPPAMASTPAGSFVSVLDSALWGVSEVGLSEISDFTDSNPFDYLAAVTKRKRTIPNGVFASVDKNATEEMKEEYVRKAPISTKLVDMFLRSFDHRSVMIKVVKPNTIVDYYPFLEREELIEMECIKLYGLRSYKRMAENSKGFINALKCVHAELTLVRAVEKFFLTFNEAARLARVFTTKGDFKAFKPIAIKILIYLALIDNGDQEAKLYIFGLRIKYSSVWKAVLNLVLVHHIFEADFAGIYSTELNALEGFVMGENPTLGDKNAQNYCEKIAQSLNKAETLDSSTSLLSESTRRLIDPLFLTGNLGS